MELPTEPDMTLEKMNSIDKENVQSINMIMLDYMVNLIFNPTEDINEAYENFKEDLKKKYSNV